MVEVNFLPWREYQRNYQIKVIKIISLVFIGLSLSIVFSAHIFLKKKIEILTVEIKKLKELKNITPKIYFQTSKKMLPNQFIEKLIMYNVATNKLFHNLAGTSGVCFTKITRNNNEIFISGKTTSPIDFTEFIKNWHAGSLFSIIKINRLQQQTKHLFVFDISATQTISFYLNPNKTYHA